MITKDLFTILNNHYLFKRHKDKLDILDSIPESKSALENILNFFESQNVPDVTIEGFEVDKRIEKIYKNSMVINHNGTTIEYKFKATIENSSTPEQIEQFSNELIIAVKIFLPAQASSYIDIKINTKNNQRNGDISSKMYIVTKQSQAISFLTYNDTISLVTNKKNKPLSISINSLNFSHDISEERLKDLAITLKNNTYNYIKLDDPIIATLNYKQVADLIFKGGLPKETIDFVLLTSDEDSLSNYMLSDKNIFDRLKINQKSKKKIIS